MNLSIKSSFLTVIAVFLLSLFSGCSEDIDNSKPTVSVLCVPLAEVVGQVVGDRFAVVSVVPEHADLHTYEPTPRDMGKLFSSEMFLAMDVPMESRFVAVLKENGVAVKDIATSVERQPISCDHDHDHDHDHEVTAQNGDPHIWLSLPNCIAMAKESVAILAEKYPEYADEFNNNANSYILKLTATHNELVEKFANYSDQRFYIFHPSLGYFAHDYDLQQVALEVDGKTPTIKQLEEVMNLAKEDGVNLILASEQFNTDLPQRAADLLKIKLEYLNPMAKDVKSELENISNLIYNDWSSKAESNN